MKTPVANSRFVDGLVGNSAPVLVLYEELVEAGWRLECFPEGTSPHTGNGSKFATADWHSNECTWKIYFPANAHAHQVYHELLHVRFKNVEGAPMMSACQYEESFRRNVEELNNDFDHAYVVPLEIAKYPEAATYWEAEFTRMFGELPSSKQVYKSFLTMRDSTKSIWITHRRSAMLPCSTNCTNS